MGCHPGMRGSDVQTALSREALLLSTIQGAKRYSLSEKYYKISGINYPGLSIQQLRWTLRDAGIPIDDQ